MSKLKSLSEGGIYYLVYNFLNMFFPFFSGLYVSRILLPESIGTVAAAQNLAQYFVIFAFLGIPTYGLREISKVRNDYEERNRVFSELFIINLSSTIFFSFTYIILVLTVPAYRNELVFYLIAGISIAFNTLNIGWLYEGLEEFRFISIRGLIFRAVPFLFLILFVRTKNDVIKYAYVSIIGTCGNHLADVLYAPKFVRFTRKRLNIKRHIKSILFLVAVNLATELYSLVDITMMNFMSDRDSIAFYKYGIGVESILIQIVNTFTIVLVPRISFYVNEGKSHAFNQLLSKAFVLIVLTSLPMIIGLYSTADFLMVAFYGEPYIASARVLKIISFCLLIVPTSYLLGSRVMLVTGHEKLMIIPVGAGAVVNIICNALLIPVYSEIGATIASVFSQTIIMIIYISMSRSHFKLTGVMNSIWKVVLSCLIMSIYLIFVGRMNIDGWVMIGMKVLGAILFYCIVLLITKERIATDFFNLFVKKIRGRV